MEPLKEDPPIKGQCIIYLSTMDKTKSPNFIPATNIMLLGPLKEDNLYRGETTLIYIGPKVSVARRFHCTQLLCSVH